MREFESGTDDELEDDAQNAAETMILNDNNLDDERGSALGKLSSSARWICKGTGKGQATGRVTGDGQWDYFKENYLNFQGQAAADSADNYSTIDLDGFAESWNKFLDQCIIDNMDPDLTYKKCCPSERGGDCLQEALQLADYKASSAW